MKTFVLFYFALIIGLSSLSSSSQAREGGYGGFTPENMQEFNDYLNGLEMIKVQEGGELNQAIDTIPINLETAIDLEQERGLRDWLRQYLIAFSESGNDSLVAAFYLRDGFDKERYRETEMRFAEDIHARKFVAQNEDGSMMTEDEIENIVEKTRTHVETALKQGALPLFRSMYKDVLRILNKEYFIENVSFHDSSFRVFELGQETPTFLRLASDQGMFPRGLSYDIGLSERLPALLAAGEKIICADVLFIVEDPLPAEVTPNPVASLPAGFTPITPNPVGPGRTPSFFRLMWDQDKKIWNHLEVFHTSIGVGNTYFFNLL